MLLDDYLRQHSRLESIELSYLIRKGDGTMKNTVISLIGKHQAEKSDNKVIRRYEKLCKLEMDADFEILMEQYNKLEWQMSPLNNKERSSSKKHQKKINSEKKSQRKLEFD